MEHDPGRLEADPADTFAAFDFFVAAEHMIDWQYPDDQGKRAAIRAVDPGKTVSHLASGAKHFEATVACHTRVAGVTREDDYGTAVWGRGRWGEATYESLGRPAMVIATADGRPRLLASASRSTPAWRPHC